MSSCHWSANGKLDTCHFLIGLTFPRVLAILIKKKCVGEVSSGPTGDGNSNFRASSAMKDSSSYKIEETSTKRILFKEDGDYRERFRLNLGKSHVIGSRNASRSHGLRMVVAVARPPIPGFKLPSVVG